MSDDGVSSSANTLFTLDTPGAAGPAGSYCEVHGYVQAKEVVVAVLFRVYYLPLSLRLSREGDAKRLDKMAEGPIERVEQGKEDWKKVSDFHDNNASKLLERNLSVQYASL
ncbi:hypothetical protein EAG_02669 [Camponotus floridanus]|uniref:Uncharacterized protein n=1 Tax=Camponotus floridanus TaxID=104421 RepID=E1ZYM3_CAMFO|nr:hypothetical protein EAG_02669 [Camponotus floridanus]